MSDDAGPSDTLDPDRDDHVPTYAEVTVVCAHPDDESFGLGALVTALADAGARLRLLWFTAGETSTLDAGPLRLRNDPASHPPLPRTRGRRST